MNERIEQLLKIKRMCMNEFKQTEVNCERYISSMTVLTKKLLGNWQEGTNFLVQYDSFITNITTIMNATRKFNLHVHLYNTKLCEMYDEFLRTNQTELQASNKYKGIKLKSISQFYPAEECNLNAETEEDFVYPTLNLCDVYKQNDVISSTVTNIKNLNELSFHILDNSSKYRAAVVELSKTLELRQYHGIPEISEVFGCVLDNQIFRAVLGSKTYYDIELNDEIIPCYILDTAEVLPLKFDHIMYKLTKEQQNIPALALPCQLKVKKNPFISKQILEDKLKTMEYEKCNLKVMAIVNNVLHVEIIDDIKMIAGPTSGDPGVKSIALENVEKKTGMQLTEEELSILYEEPLNTSNAMKAVMGYDPQDDKRICQFYDPLTGGCFKGAKCKFEHTLRQVDGWTKDVVPTVSIMDNYPTTLFASGTIINVTPTYVGQLDRFFAQINEPHKINSPLIYNDDDVPSSKLLTKPPLMFDMVLSRYVDDLWYRAKIISHDDNYKTFKVFYVDYGNTQIVDLRNLASIDISIARLPFQAVLCRFDTVHEKPNLSVDERKNGIATLCEIILNKSIDVKVVSHYEDLFISILDKNSYPLPELIINMGYLEVNSHKVHL